MIPSRLYYGMFYSNYTDKSFLISGDDTKDNKESLKALGGKWNSTLKGWIFPKTKEKLVTEWLDGVSNKKESDTNKSIIEKDQIAIVPCFMVSGKDTVKHKDKLKEFGGVWNTTLQGWVFPEKQKERINKWLNSTGEEMEDDEECEEVEDADE